MKVYNREADFVLSAQKALLTFQEICVEIKTTLLQ
jgi:hypothetical protein